MVVGSATILNLIPSGVMPVVYLNQTDAGYDKQFLVYNGSQPYNVPEGVSVTIRGRKGDNYGITENAEFTAGSNLITVHVTEQMTAVAGDKNIFELVFVDAEGLRVGTINIVFAVESDALGDAVISESEISYAEHVMTELQSIHAEHIQIQQNKANIAKEVQDRIAAVTAEKNRAESAETTLQNNITAEANRAKAAEATLQSNINAEAYSRSTATSNLQAQINQIVTPSGSAPSAAEVENARIGADGVTYDTLGNAIRTQVSDLQNSFSGLGNRINLFNYQTRVSDYNYKIMSDVTGTTEPGIRQASAGNFLSGYIPCEPNTTYVFKVADEAGLYKLGAGCRVIYYKSDRYGISNNWIGDGVQFTTPSNAAYLSFSSIETKYDVSKLMLFKVSDTPDKYYPYNYINVNGWGDALATMGDNYDVFSKTLDLYVSSDWIKRDIEQIYAYTVGTAKSTGTSITPHILSGVTVSTGDVITFDVASVRATVNPNGLTFLCLRVATLNASGGVVRRINLTGEKQSITINSGEVGFNVFIYFTKDASEEWNEAFVYTLMVRRGGLALNPDIIMSTGDTYIIGTDFVRKPVRLIKLGTLTTPSHFQAFVIYSGNYYCIDSDGNLVVIDSSFSTVSQTALSFGHGNSMQLGESNYAYISGWDDATVYKLDLDELTVETLFTIPESVTFGNQVYFSAAVDEANSLAYILLRYSAPVFPTINNFIVYDYVNDSVIENKKFGYSFNGVQSMDFYCGRIAVTYGAGSVEYAPERGLFIMDTNGTMLSRYVVAELEGKEPEGILVSRDSGELLFTIGDALYRIE